jgi:sarcosine oxidase
MSEKLDVIVVGAGATGLATAWKIAQAGRSVTVLEQFGRAHKKGSSHGGSRIYRATYVQREYLDLMHHALDMWRELESDSGYRLLSEVGLVSHGFPPHDFEQPMRAAGIPLEVLRPEEAQERWPGMRFEGKVLHEHKTAGRVNADLTLVALEQELVRHGGSVVYGAQVTDVQAEVDGVIVESSAGTYRADKIVLAAGGWTNKLAPQLLGLDQPLDMKVVEVAPAHFDIVSERAGSLTESTWPSFTHDHASVDPTTGESSHWPGIVYGLATDGEGIKVGFNAYGVTLDPDQRTFTPRDGDVQLHADYVREWLPGLDAETAAPLSCTYTRTPHDDFLIDRSGRVVVASPCSGHGFKFMPALGEMIANVTLGDESEISSLRPDLFSLARVLA